MKKDVLKISNAQAFWGDWGNAAAELMAQQPDLDFITLDYLAEVSLSIMAIQRERDATAGYARDFLEVIKSLIPYWKKGSKVRVVTNAGGLNPLGCAQACKELLEKNGCGSLKLAMVSGDDMMPVIRSMMSTKGGMAGKTFLSNAETGRPLEDILDRMVTANAYLGAPAIADAILQGADVVITGRVADPSLTVGPCMAHYHWKMDEFNRIAGATVAGHLIECGTQVTGGFSTDWLKIPDFENIGFPIAEVAEDGSCVITKPGGTGGRVDVQTVKEQLLYEIGDPSHYLSPDGTVSFLSLKVQADGKNRVRISGARGGPPPSSYKVSGTFRDGYKAHGMLTLCGRQAVKKAERCAEVVFQRLQRRGIRFQRTHVECLGSGASAPGVLKKMDQLMETVLRISVADPRKEAVEEFSRALMPLITAGPQGITGYAGGRPKVQPVFSYWPCLMPREHVKPVMKIL